MRKKLVIGNWKMHGGLETNAGLLAALVRGAAGLSCDVAVCISFPYLAQGQALLSGSSLVLGAQNASEYAQGAYTGEVAAAMLKDFGCRYVIVGHSERRMLFGESDAVVAAKFAAVLAVGLTPILCVGETLVDREAGRAQDVVFSQLAAVLDRVGEGAFGRAVLAYEPVWAIGTGKTATSMQAQEMHSAIRTWVAAADSGIGAGLQILYGGSIKPGNAAELFAQADVDGGLVGGAALVAEDFLAICCMAN